MSLSLIMLRGGSADTIIARPPSCIHPSTPTFFHPDSVPAERFALIVSALVPYKRIELAIDACRTGRHAAADRRRAARSAPRWSAARERNCQFLGRLTDADIRDLYRRASVVLLPGEEDFGIVPLEAQACGRPVVALGRGGARETVVHGETGFLVDEPSAAAFADAISRAARPTGSTRWPFGSTPSGSAASGSATRWKRW